MSTHPDHLHLHDRPAGVDRLTYGPDIREVRRRARDGKPFCLILPLTNPDGTHTRHLLADDRAHEARRRWSWRSGERARQRFKESEYARVAQRLGARRDAPFYILPLDGSTDDRLQLDDPIGMQRLRGMVEDLQPRVLVLDTLCELHTCREDLSDDMGPLLRPVRQLAHQTGTSIIVNHHQNKGGNFRGSTAIRAAFDLEWAFTRTDDADESDGCPRGTLKIEGRHGPRLVLKVRVRKDLQWELDGTVIAPRDPGARERILSHLIAVNDWQTAEDIATATSIKLKTIQNVLAATRREMPPPLAVQGTGAKNEPRRYRTRAPHFEGFSIQDAEEMVPPDFTSQGEDLGGKHVRRAPGEAGSDRWTP